MSAAATPTTRFLNRAGRWLDFVHVGLERREDGALQLESLPLLPRGTAAEPAGEPPDAPAGVAALPGGDVAFTDPERPALVLVDGCDGSARAVPVELSSPRGVLVHRARRSLLVADSGAGRIAVLALPDLELVETWDANGGLHEPQSLAADADGNVYVADGATHRVDKLDPLLGEPVARFAEATRDIAATEVAAAGDRVVVLDEAGDVHVVDTAGAAIETWSSGAAAPLGLALAGDRVIVGDNERRRLLVFDVDGRRIGEAVGYETTVAAIALDGDGLLVCPGGGRPPVRLELVGGHGRRGVLLGGPFLNPSPGSDPVHWLRAAVAGVGERAHVQLHVASRVVSTRPPVDLHRDDPFADQAWQRILVAADANETLFAGRSTREWVWIGMQFAGDGTGTPVLSQIRLDFDHATYLQYLPALYQRDRVRRELLRRWLTLFESASDQVQLEIEALPRRFDPAAAPDAGLPWLAGWLGLELPERWDEQRSRAAIATAFAAAARRGTPRALADEVQAQTGLEAVIEEPIGQARWWALAGEGAGEQQAAMSVLGVSSMLATGEPQGAVAGTSAVLDGSFLSSQAAFGRPLFTSIAHQFTVRVYRGPRYSEDAIAAARAVLDRERPAHTVYHLCVVEPCMRVGVQARIGIDSIVAGPSGPGRLGDPRAGGLRLAGEPAGRIAQTAELGRTYLTDTATS